MKRFPSAICLAFVAATILSSCGPAAKPAGKVSGTVSYKGQPVPNGTVNFLSATGGAAQAKITEGAFVVEGTVETGEYKVYVSPPRPEPQAPGTKIQPPAQFPVPPKFHDPGTSGVKATVAAGENKLPVDLKD